MEERDPEDELQEFNPSFEEKREFKRLQIQGNFSFAALDSIRIVCSLKDVGMGGFSASLDEGVFISPGENLTGKLILWEDVDPFDFVGSVRWSTQSLFGIEFTKISPRSRGKIKEFIENPPEMEK